MIFLERLVLEHLVQQGTMTTRLRESGKAGGEHHEYCQGDSTSLADNLGISDADLLAVLHRLEKAGLIRYLEEVNRFDPSEYICKWAAADADCSPRPVTAHRRAGGKYHAQAFRTLSEAVTFLFDDNCGGELTAIRLEIRIASEDLGGASWSQALDDVLI
jgi:hypothetical protein